jgi:polyhydroxyalkanoate synthase
MLGVWASWIEATSKVGRGMLAGAGDDGAAGPGKPWWQMTTDDVLGGALAAGAKQLGDALAKDPILRSVDQMWNANPMRDVVPVDWAEVARALRTVWLRSLSEPSTAMAAAAELNANLWRSALDAWNEAGRRWWDGTPATGPAPAGGGATSGSLRRSGTRTPSTAR